ncbi:prepilin-type N-terminal cleavage/methylation domain-containing protein [Clostridium sp. AM58-1XD]|uniref:type II secretion system protein n=1 Tax=Clostridium sp. AM58-1XD TaxID=2292307 RepID=UPI000E53B783|nr:prepilin-type N-terminal cleavage/methylation domain-containing protein [Clostridium sp. AM58-1XD]RGZ00164.1 prepilin-type N-terminal cleavage/methylation domain-containing protein [Clostridium sp. AM58-1XD]
MKKNNKGFSLIELIIAVAILVVLSGLLAPQLIKYVERSREAKDVQMLDSIYVAVNTALTNEEAYDKFVDGTNTGGNYVDIDSGMSIKDIMDKNDAFSKEVASILGKSSSELTLNSKRASGGHNADKTTVNNIFVIVQSKEGSDKVEGLEVGVYVAPAKDGTHVDGFDVGTTK